MSVRSRTCRSPGEQARMSAATLIPRHQATNPVTLLWIRGQKPHTPPKARHWRTHHPAPADLAVGDIASMPSIGSSSAPALFNHYAEALNWIMANNYGVQLLHYLDDFLLVGPPGKDTCPEAMSRVLLVCVLLGIPVASEKLEGPTTTLTFLGTVLDTSEQQLCLPRDKRQLRKLHHHVNLNAKATADIRWWDSFLPSWNGVTMFLDTEWTAADSLQLFTDASGSLGFGTYYNGAWFQGD
ncbi:hypothetical protein EMCRGX_G002059 [Ephydatia muelleri]